MQLALSRRKAAMEHKFKMSERKARNAVMTVGFIEVPPNRASKKLPVLPFARRHRAPRPSKSDNPDYRKPVLVKQPRELCLT